MSNKTSNDKIPPGLKWSLDNAIKALFKGQFIRVGEDKIKYRVITGAPKSWNSNDPEASRVIFNTT